MYLDWLKNMASIKLLLQRAVQYDLIIPHVVVKSAYLNVPLYNEIYVELPKALKQEFE